MTRAGAQPPTDDRRAIIDIGSNTVRLVIYAGPERAPVTLHNEKVTAQLGQGVARDGQLAKKAMAQALAALARYARLLALHGITRVETVATAASRDAVNGPEFLDAVRATGLAPRLLSGEEEALTSAMGVVGAYPGARGVVADLGGGSLELVHIDDGHCEHGVSLPLGSLRLPLLREGGAARFSRRIHKLVIGSGWACAGGETLYLVGGSHRAFAEYAMHAADWPIDDQHGFELSAEAALGLCRSIAHRPALDPVAGISASRLASLPDVAALLSVLLREVRPARLVFSAWGLREGLLYRAMPAGVRAQNPLVAGVADFAATQGVPETLARQIAEWTAPAAGDARSNLRLAAIMLALAAHGAEAQLRADLALDWSLRKRWIGVSASDRAMIAACALAHAGRGARIAELERLADRESLREARTWGLALRLCRRLSGLAPAALADSALQVGEGRIELVVRGTATALCTDPVEKDLRTLAEALGLKPAIARA